jgi:hypothetical protein
MQMRALRRWLLLFGVSPAALAGCVAGSGLRIRQRRAVGHVAESFTAGTAKWV